MIKNLKDMPDYFGPKELIKVLPIGKNRAYELCRADGFPAMRVGKSIIISREGLEEWLDKQIGTNRLNKEKSPANTEL